MKRPATIILAVLVILALATALILYSIKSPATIELTHVENAQINLPAIPTQMLTIDQHRFRFPADLTHDPKKDNPSPNNYLLNHQGKHVALLSRIIIKDKYFQAWNNMFFQHSPYHDDFEMFKDALVESSTESSLLRLIMNRKARQLRNAAGLITFSYSNQCILYQHDCRAFIALKKSFAIANLYLEGERSYFFLSWPSNTAISRLKTCAESSFPDRRRSDRDEVDRMAPQL